MLIQKQIIEIREHLEKSQRPLFFFDNDADGLCSFLLLQRFIGRGKGVPIKGSPENMDDYLRKVSELNADSIFILDKPIVSREFLENVDKLGVAIIWIDHHENDLKDIPDFVNYYNPLLNELKNNEPTTYLCYQVSQKKEDMWIATLGCISDGFIPEFYPEFRKEYPDLSIEADSAFDIFYKSTIGKILKLFSFGLKDRTTNVMNMLRFLIKVRSPYEILEEGKENYTMHKRFKEISQKYEKLREKIKKINKDGKLLFFQYSGDMSMSSDLANELSYKNPEKFVLVAYVKGDKVNISGRGNDIRKYVLKVIEGLEGARGGGHENAVGAQVRINDIDEFRNNVERLIG